MKTLKKGSLAMAHMFLLFLGAQIARELRPYSALLIWLAKRTGTLSETRLSKEQRMPIRTQAPQDPIDGINTRILHPGSTAQDKEDSRNSGL